jgi:hypothetical protein
MNTEIDIGYVSHFLIHWAGRDKPPSEQASILSQIASSCRLKLSPNQLFFDGSTRIIDKMTCFTDVPLSRSSKHCAKYSKFGIAFHKLKLMNKSAQPIFYYTHVFIRDMRAIYNFVLDQIDKPSLDADVVRALHRHFYFVKEFSDGPANSRDSFYYEREWRIGSHCLIPAGQNKGKWCLQNKLPTSLGTLVREGNDEYFKFELEDVAFLIVPGQYLSQIVNPYGFLLKPYEDLVNSEEE